ncbi:MAG: hypothetical protein AB8I08_01660 [Sandaracinaceae bacterium]
MLAYTSEQTRVAVAPDGRWGGDVCRRAWPEEDAIRALDPETRRRLSQTWLGQAATEARVATSFAQIHRSLQRLGADADLIALAGRAVDDEHRHAALAEELAGRYAGHPVGPYRPLPGQMPAHPSAETDTLRHALWVVGQCALNETLATAYLDAARIGAKTRSARFAIRELMEDEIDHARIGWSFLAALSREQKAPLAEWILPLTVCNLREWNRLSLPDDDTLWAHGVPPYETARDAVRDALSGVLLPGFAHVGVETGALERWIARGAPLEGPFR